MGSTRWSNPGTIGCKYGATGTLYSRAVSMIETLAQAPGEHSNLRASSISYDRKKVVFSAITAHVCCGNQTQVPSVMVVSDIAIPWYGDRMLMTVLLPSQTLWIGHVSLSLCHQQLPQRTTPNFTVLSVIEDKFWNPHWLSLNYINGSNVRCQTSKSVPMASQTRSQG